MGQTAESGDDNMAIRSPGQASGCLRRESGRGIRLSTPVTGLGQSRRGGTGSRPNEGIAKSWTMSAKRQRLWHGKKEGQPFGCPSF